MSNQLNLFESILDLLSLKPIFMLGFIILGIWLYWLFKKDSTLPKVRIMVGSMLMYYYLCIVLYNIVGIPTINELSRIIGLGESIFHPHLNLIPLVGGVHLEFILNIFCFIPLGFFSVLISKPYNKMKNSVMLGFCISFIIEMSQMFTLYRATDINDLIANTFGALVGYLCFKSIPNSKIQSEFNVEDKTVTRYLPIFITTLAMIMTFVS